MKNIFSFLLIVALGLSFGCDTNSEYGSASTNPPAEGFNLEGSDPEAIAIADEVMQALGGRQAWDDTRYLHWTFFGRRTLLWDKKTGQVRIDVPEDSTVYLVNIFDKTGKVQLNGVDISQTDSLDQYLDRGEAIWINDSYWLVMPYKLKDSGVTLKYLRQDTMMNGAMADVLQLTFEEVGKTPNNKYQVYVDLKDRLVKQWDFFQNYTDSEPRFSTPWADYQRHGDILLSGNRGTNQLSDIKVLTEVPRAAFTDFERPEIQ